MKTTMCLGFFLWLSFLKSALGGQEPADDSMRVFQDVEYAHVGHRSLLLDLQIPRELLNPPLLVWVHGGGWQKGDKAPQPLKWLAPYGYALASIGYRLSGEATFPAQIYDCKAAIRWLRANADHFGYDGDRIGAVGASAGGHLVALLGTTGGVDSVEGHIGQDLDVSSRVQAVVDYFGPTDFFLDVRTGSREPHIAPEPVEKLFGGTPSARQEIALMASAARFVTADDPPILIIHGDLDPVVSVEQSLYLKSLYEQNGLDSELIRVPDKGHDGRLLLDPGIRERVATFLERTLLREAEENRESPPVTGEPTSHR